MKFLLATDHSEYSAAAINDRASALGRAAETDEE